MGLRIALAGSMEFAKEIIDIKENLEKKGHSVVAPKNIEKHSNGTTAMENREEKIKFDLFRSYFKKIERCDILLVINKDKNNIINYVGANSLIEMAFAHVLNKKIFLMNAVPSMNYIDEIMAMKPAVIAGDLSKLEK